MSRRLYVSIFGLVVLAIGAALLFGLHGTGAADECTKLSGTTHKLTIANDKVTPSGTVQAKLCDQLVIANTDSEAREIAFGPHDHHVPYDGVAERVLNRGQSLTITLNKAGTYHWHDHEHDEIGGYFTVVN